VGREDSRGFAAAVSQYVIDPVRAGVPDIRQTIQVSAMETAGMLGKLSGRRGIQGSVAVDGNLNVAHQVKFGQ
jgi:hypothetical protein